MTLNFKNEKTFGKILAFCCLSTQYLTLIFRFNYLLLGRHSVEDMSDIASNILGNIETIMKISSFYIYGKEHLTLIEKLSEKFKKGLIRSPIQLELILNTTEIPGYWMSEITYKRTFEKTEIFFVVCKIIGFSIICMFWTPSVYFYFFQGKRVFPLKME